MALHNEVDTLKVGSYTVLFKKVLNSVEQV